MEGRLEMQQGLNVISFQITEDPAQVGGTKATPSQGLCFSKQCRFVSCLCSLGLFKKIVFFSS